LKVYGSDGPKGSRERLIEIEHEEQRIVLDALKGFTILDIKVTGRLPELYVQLSNDRWIHSFATTETQPEWTIFLNDRSWLTVKRGRIVREKNLRATK